ncbi:MAG TPA: GxxExxY protein [Flavobacteriales bacterium]|nr:GxxExxY protein [Flavobacteriales bacterium]HQX30908.1 GxxExxY protein [Flavobacteriales bacterium]HQX39394.1 GxxExxY protein [Flavobacteriales bacterium]HQZ43943.1 GxxExxY protein [Flavobacteriales bacterium]HQZ93657.1 GxxExxY protein [Flavobacteriales bacterium]
MTLIDMIENDESQLLDAGNYKHSELTEQVIKAFYTVYNTLGYGFLEKVYENAMLHELRKMGLNVKNQHPITVFYDGVKVGTYSADLLVEELVIIELKAAKDFCEADEYQLVNYLKATNSEVGLLLNFGKKPRIKRKVFSNLS